MRTHRHLVIYESILQTLNEPGCPFCRFLKEFQAARLQSPKDVAIHHVCNFHAWGLAAVRDAQPQRKSSSGWSVNRLHPPAITLPAIYVWRSWWKRTFASANS